MSDRAKVDDVKKLLTLVAEILACTIREGSTLRQVIVKRDAMNSEGEFDSVLMTPVLRQTAVLPQQRANKCTSSAAAREGAMKHSGTCKSIVPDLDVFPSFFEAAPPVLTQTTSLLAAVSNYMNSSKSVKRRHSPNERNNCCLCHTGEDSDRTAIHTLEELKASVRNDVADMLRSIWNGLSTLKTDLKNSCGQHLPPLPREQPVALQPVSTDVLVETGTAMNPITFDSNFPAQNSQHDRTESTLADQMVGELPMRTSGGNSTGTEARIGAEPPYWYSEKLKEKNRKIAALQGTVHELVNKEEKFTVAFEKMKRYLSNEAQQRRSLSSSSFPDGRPALYRDLFDSFKSAVAALDSFTTSFVAYSEARLHAPANRIWKPNFRNVFIAKESHWTYALKAFFCEKMFVGFENESFMTDAASLHLDRTELRKESYAYFRRGNSVESSPYAAPASTDVHFRTYCAEKFESMVPDTILLQPGDYAEGNTERAFPTIHEINLSKTFMLAAMKIWTLHKLCFAFEPAVNIFRARRGHDVDWKFVESVVKVEDDDMFVQKVGFMIAPGFRLHDATVKSQIYLAGKGTASQAGLKDHAPGISAI